MENFVIYHRVSTVRQGASGLGLEAQAEVVSAFLASRPHQVIASFVEIESGKKSDRPELIKALAECKRKKAVLLISKLDRLSRSLAFLTNLMDSGVEFVAADNPHASRFMLHLLGAFAEHERSMISQRTKDALAMAKARGVKLGINGNRLAERNRAEARERDTPLHPIISSLMRELCSYRRVAQRMNELSIATPSGGKWHGSSIRNVCLRAVKLNGEGWAEPLKTTVIHCK